METLMLSDQYRDYIVQAAKPKVESSRYQQQAPSIDPSTLDPKYVAIYEYISGLLEGAAYEDGSICQASTNGMAYYGLKMYEASQALIPNPLTITLNGQKFTEQYSIFFA